MLRLPPLFGSRAPAPHSLLASLIARTPEEAELKQQKQENETCGHSFNFSNKRSSKGLKFSLWSSGIRVNIAAHATVRVCLAG